MTLPQTPQDWPHAFAAAWKDRDADALAMLFAEDADFVNVVGLWWRTRPAIRKAHHYGLTTFFSKTTLRIGGVSCRALGPDYATLHARMTLTGQLTPDGALAGKRQTIFLSVLQHTTEGWLAVCAQNTDVIPNTETHVADGQNITAMDYRA